MRRPMRDFGKFVLLILLRSSARVILPSRHDFEIATASTCAATQLGAPNGVVSPNFRLNAATIDLTAGSDLTSGAKNDTYAPVKVNDVESNTPSVPRMWPL